MPWSNEDATAVTGEDVVCNGVRLVCFTKSVPESIYFTAAVVFLDDALCLEGFLPPAGKPYIEQE